MIGKARDIVEWLFQQEDREAVYDIRPYRPKRSLNANSYAWLLIGRIADALRTDKDAVYLEMLKRYGQSEIVSVLSSINVSGYFKHFECIGESYLYGKKFSHYKIFKGSSEYDSREMAVLIDGIISEAKEMGIETETPEMIEKFKSEWGD